MWTELFQVGYHVLRGRADANQGPQYPQGYPQGYPPYQNGAVYQHPGPVGAPYWGPMSPTASPMNPGTYPPPPPQGPSAPQSVPFPSRPSPTSGTHANNHRPQPSPAPRQTQSTTSSRARHNASSAPTPRRMPGTSRPASVKKILSLDGGGVRGLSEIMILKYMMKSLARTRGYELHPWQEFDMIGGTSTGGLLAIMLGRLRMTLDECEAAYIDLSKSIFTPVRSDLNVVARLSDFVQANGRFPATGLETGIKDILEDKGFYKDEVLSDFDGDSCKVFVCAIRQEDGSTALLRSYETEFHDTLWNSCKIWEAARATSAASTFFDPIAIGPFRQKFADGALRHNNPISLVDVESNRLWPDDTRLIISIGTGTPPAPDLTGNIKSLAETLVKIATETEETNRLFRLNHRNMIDEGLLYRFNVEQGLGSVPLEEFKSVARIASCTDSYLQNPDVMAAMRRCAAAMHNGGQRLGYMGGEELSHHLENLRMAEVASTHCSICITGIPYNTPYRYCPLCNQDVCSACNGHPGRHRSALLQFVSVSWQPKMSTRPESRTCVQCSKTTKARIECDGCAVSLCHECYAVDPSRKAFFENHTRDKPLEKMFSVVRSPYWAVTPQIAPQVCHCQSVPGVIDHCQRCNSPMPASDTSYCCRTCRVEFGDGQELCWTCWESDDASHKAQHQFQLTTYVQTNVEGPNLEQEAKSAYQCRDCLQNLYGRDVAHHEHLNLICVLTPAIMDALRMVNFMKCVHARRHEPLHQPLHPTGTKCGVCKIEISFNEPWSFCKVGCAVAICVRCLRAGRGTHRHWMANVVSVRNDVTDPRFCNCCRQHYSRYAGFTCADCKNWDMCHRCMLRMIAKEIPNSLSDHRSLLCSGTNFIFYTSA